MFFFCDWSNRGRPTASNDLFDGQHDSVSPAANNRQHTGNIDGPVVDHTELYPVGLEATAHSSTCRRLCV